MTSINNSEREESRIAQIANEYRQQGYDVRIQPKSSELPNFLINYQPDIIARSEKESVVIEVMSHSNLPKLSSTSQIAEIIETKPGWRFELVMTNPKDRTSVSSESRLPTVKELSRRLISAKRLVNIGDYEVAVAIAWSAAEGLLRLIANDEKIVLDQQPSSNIIKKAYSLGLLDSTSYQELNDLYEIRNSIVHGLVEPNLKSSAILRFIDTVRKILTSYRRKLMQCKCPVCDRNTSSVGTLFSHLINIHDPGHEKWLKTYCQLNNIDLMKLLADRVRGIKNANKPLTDALRKDFCI